MKWPTTTIGSVSQRTRARDPRERPSDLFKYIDIASIDRDQKVITQTSEMHGADAPSRARKEVKAGDILVSTVRPNLNAVAIVPPELDGQIASTGFCVLRPNSELVDGRYLFYFVRTSVFIDDLTSKVRGAHYPAVSDSDVKSTELPLPPLAEQRRIAEILDQADALRKQRAEADAKAARILPALFYQLFGDLAVNNKGFPKEKIGKYVKVQGGFAFKSSDFVESGVLVVRIGNLENGYVVKNKAVYLNESFYKEYARFRLNYGDLLVALTGATTGKTARYWLEDEPALLNQRVGRFLVKPEVFFSLDYLESIISSEYVQSKIWQNARGFGQPNIAPRTIEEFEIPVAPEELQRKYSELLKTLIPNRNNQEKSKYYLDVLLVVLLHRAFSGELTAKWREAHMKELLQEMEHQARALG